MYQGRERDVIGLLDVFDELMPPVKESITIFIVARGPEICDPDHWYVIIQQGYPSMQVIPLLFSGLNVVYDCLHSPSVIMDDVEDIIEIVPKAKYYPMVRSPSLLYNGYYTVDVAITDVGVDR
jgi:hypothetical protein